jgi:outer membrane protein
MKKLMALAILATVFTASTYAQKFAFVDSDYILRNIPSYIAAQEELDNLSESWEEVIKKEYAVIEEMYKSYKAERVLLSDEMRQEREEDIIKKENEVKALQQHYFGPEGDLFQKREELVKPVQDAVYKAVRELSAEGGYVIIFDTASGASILYSNPRYDMSDEILQRMGYK